MTEQTIKVGIFDSGLGGLSVVRELRKQLPAQPMIYFGDQIHTPYGVRSLEEVRQLTTKAVQFLFGQGAQLIVIACNTASVASLKSLRAQFPETPFVGMEPAVKPAAEQTHSKVVGVLATYATFQSELYASVVERFARDVKVLQSPCPGLVAEIEKGNLRGDETWKILHTALDPMIAEGIDTVVMGCTHYPFVIPLVKEIVGPDVVVIDPAPAIARRTEFLLKEHGWLNTEGGQADIVFYTSGNPRSLSDLLPELIGESGEVRQAVWQDGRLH
mgnify:CR=1 FL=1|jgi:glutamate racemase